METTVRAKSPFAILAILLGAVVLVALTGLNSGAMPPLPARVILGVAIPTFFATSFAAIWDTSRAREAALRPSRRPPEAARPAEDDLQRASEIERVQAWRTARLAGLGVAEETARILATHPTFSVHELERLLETGCPLATALRILRPA
jgi:hypothetical protein